MGMIACLDVHYTDQLACAAAVVIEDWASESPVALESAVLPHHAVYEPGRFYLRELPPLLEVIRKIQQPIDCFVVDGYCTLSPEGAPGMGAHLAAALDRPVAIIGVAKTCYRQSTHAHELKRGDSQRPLYITAIGMDVQQAAAHIAAMTGPYRLPTLIKAADRLSRSLETAAAEERELSVSTAPSSGPEAPTESDSMLTPESNLETPS